MAKQTQNRKAAESDVNDLALIPYAEGMGITLVDPSDAMKEAQSGISEMLPKVVNFKQPGQRITGRLIGKGPDVELEDAAGESRRIPTFVFDLGRGARVALMASYQLEHQLPALEGKIVRVTYMEQVETRKGQRVKDYLIEVMRDASAQA